MGNAPGYVLVAAVVVGVAWSIARAAGRRTRRQAATRVLAGVLQGTVDKQGHAVGTYGPYKVEAHLSYSSGVPTDVSSSNSGRNEQVHQLHVRLEAPVRGGRMWACRRRPGWPGQPSAIDFIPNPTGFLPGAKLLLGRLGVEQIDPEGQYRLSQAGLLEAIDALGHGRSGWLPQVSRMAGPELPVALLRQVQASGHGDGQPPGTMYGCSMEVDGPELTPGQFRARLDTLIRVAQIDASVNR